MRDQVPAWCQYGRGRSRALVIVPHGGRREAGAAAGRDGLKVNDLHTAGVGAELATALDASYVINPLWDRNALDLNRLSQVSDRAPWFLALLEELLGDILRRHACADVMIIHGWNISQPKCDIGVGRRLATAADAAAHAGELTVSPDYAVNCLGPLQAACAARGIIAVFGERYPARHPNNVLQLFRRRPHGRCAAPQLAAWAAQGRIEAVQIELGIPVRWPGRLRSAFAQAVAECALQRPTPPRIHAPTATHRPQQAAARGADCGGGDPATARVADAPAGGAATAGVGATGRPISSPSRAGDPLAPPPGYALQCYDPVADLGIVVRVEPAGAGVSARVLLFVAGGGVGLFTGEEPRAVAMSAGGPHVQPADDGFRVRFDGELLTTDDGDRYVDLEAAFAASQLSALHLDLSFHRGAAPGLGSVRGVVALDGGEWAVDALGSTQPLLLQRGLGEWRSQLTVSGIFGPDLGVRVRHVVPGDNGVLHELSAGGEASRPLRAVAVHLDRAGRAPTHFTLRGSGEDVLAEPLTRMMIVRTGGARRTHVSFGVASVQHGERKGFGFYEYATVLPAA